MTGMKISAQKFTLSIKSTSAEQAPPPPGPAASAPPQPQAGGPKADHFHCQAPKDFSALGRGPAQETHGAGLASKLMGNTASEKCTHLAGRLTHPDSKVAHAAHQELDELRKQAKSDPLAKQIVDGIDATVGKEYNKPQRQPAINKLLQSLQGLPPAQLLQALEQQINSGDREKMLTALAARDRLFGGGSDSGASAPQDSAPLAAQELTLQLVSAQVEVV
jgi:hypothetical protein